MVITKDAASRFRISLWQCNEYDMLQKEPNMKVLLQRHLSDFSEQETNLSLWIVKWHWVFVSRRPSTLVVLPSENSELYKQLHYKISIVNDVQRLVNTKRAELGSIYRRLLLLFLSFIPP
jgi:hypothetical protein